MTVLIASARAALVSGSVLAALVLLVAIISGGVDAIGLASFLLRAIHVVAAMVWVGMIWFVNFVQHPAVVGADDAGRGALMRLVVPNVVWIFRHASHLVILSGALLLLPTGYLLGSWIYGAPVYFSPVKTALLWGAVAGGIVMWALVHHAIWPSLQIVLGERPGNADAKAAARAKVARYARINLLLAVPVTVLMVAAAHLF
jgi:uncharacterized membrane protein